MRTGILLSCGTLLFYCGLARGQQAALGAPGPTVPAPLSGAADGSVWLPQGAPQGAPQGGPPRIWFGAEYLMWWTKASPQPVPLVTTSPDNPLIIGSSGVLTSPTTAVLLGGQAINTALRSGGRFTGGLWLDDGATVGVEGSYFFLAPATAVHNVGTPGTPGSANLFVPFFDVSGTRTVNGLPGEATGPVGGLPFAGPFNALAGTFTERLSSTLQGAELNGLYQLAGTAAVRLDGLAGFRWVQLHEDLTFSSNIVAIPGPFAGLFYNSIDDFSVRNNFYGGQLGLRATAGLTERLSLIATGKVALGDMNQTALVNGITSTNFPGIHTLIPGGAFTQPTNIGSYSRNRFAVLPEVTVNLGYQVTPWARVFVGYNFLYLSSVARPGDLVDRNINSSGTAVAAALLTPRVGPPAPTFSFRDTDFWAQGINFGVQLGW